MKLLGRKVDADLLAAYRSSIPNNIQLTITENGDTYMAIITGLEHDPLPQEEFLVTEGRTQAELVQMVNDLVLTYKRIPDEYRPFYRNLLKPEGAIAEAGSHSLVKSA